MAVIKNGGSPFFTLIMWLFQGSTVARQASEKEKAKELPTFKDNDFLNEGAIIQIGKEQKEKLMTMLQADVEVCLCSSGLKSPYFN